MVLPLEGSAAVHNRPQQHAVSPAVHAGRTALAELGEGVGGVRARAEVPFRVTLHAACAAEGCRPGCSVGRGF